jgi:CheY-like chemotaxis protein
MDDEVMIRNMLRQLLESLEYSVECVQDGTEAVTAYQRAQEAGQPFTAVILDYTIPGGIGGLETLAHLRAIDPQVTALISSGYANNPVMADWAYYQGDRILIPCNDVDRRLENDLIIGS